MSGDGRDIERIWAILSSIQDRLHLMTQRLEDVELYVTLNSPEVEAEGSDT